MGKPFDIGYFKKQKTRDRAIVSKKRTVLNKICAWNLDKEYYDGKRINGYGGFRYDGRWKPVAEDFIKHYKLKPNSKISCSGSEMPFPSKLSDIPLRNHLKKRISDYGSIDTMTIITETIKTFEILIQSGKIDKNYLK